MKLLVWAHKPFGHQEEFKGFLVGTSYMNTIVYRDIFPLFLTCLWYCLSVLAYFSYLARLAMGMFGFFSGIVFVSTPGVPLENSSEESGMRPKTLTLFRAKTNHFPWKGFKIFDTNKKKVSSSFSLTLLNPVYFKTVLAQ